MKQPWFEETDSAGRATIPIMKSNQNRKVINFRSASTAQTPMVPYTQCKWHKPRTPQYLPTKPD